MSFGNTTIIFHNQRISPYDFPSFGCGMPMFGGFTPGCFGYGFGSPFNAFEFGAGAGLGMAAGMMLAPAIPAIFKGVGSICSFVWNKAIHPVFKAVGSAASFVWNKALVPIGKAVWNGIKGLANGVKNLWNKIFHKKS